MPEARLVRMTAGELGEYLTRMATLTHVVRWNGEPVAIAEATRRALTLDATVSVAAHGAEVYALN